MFGFLEVGERLLGAVGFGFEGGHAAVHVGLLELLLLGFTFGHVEFFGTHAFVHILLGLQFVLEVGVFLFKVGDGVVYFGNLGLLQVGVVHGTLLGFAEFGLFGTFHAFRQLRDLHHLGFAFLDVLRTLLLLFSDHVVLEGERNCCRDELGFERGRFLVPLGFKRLHVLLLAVLVALHE